MNREALRNKEKAAAEFLRTGIIRKLVLLSTLFCLVFIVIGAFKFFKWAVYDDKPLSDFSFVSVSDGVVGGSISVEVNFEYDPRFVNKDCQRVVRMYLRDSTGSWVNNFIAYTEAKDRVKQAKLGVKPNMSGVYYVPIAMITEDMPGGFQWKSSAKLSVHWYCEDFLTKLFGRYISLEKESQEFTLRTPTDGTFFPPGTYDPRAK